MSNSDKPIEMTVHGKPSRRQAIQWVMGALGPAASEVGVVEMVDEWISAPYPPQQADRKPVLSGLAWIDAEAARRFGKTFAQASDEQRRAICDDICFHATAKPQFKEAAD